MLKRALIAGALIAALTTVAPAVAPADGPDPGIAAAQSGAKDYSRNAATGDFAGAAEASAAQDDLRHAAPTSSLAGTASPPAAGDREPARVDSPWPAVALGFAGGFVVALGATLAARRTRVAA